MANTPEKPQMSDDERADLMAMIAAGRDLSPELDKSLVDSYAERRSAEQKARDKVQGTSQSNAIVPQQSGGSMIAGVHPAVAVTGILVIAAVFITIMIVTGGHGWWLIFPLCGIFGGWWGNNDRNRIRNEHRAQRYQMRADMYRARMGLPSRDEGQRLPEPARGDSGPLPPPIGVPTQTPPATRSVPPATPPSTNEQPPVNPAG